jgi:hypothetical protein
MLSTRWCKEKPLRLLATPKELDLGVTQHT